MDADPVNAPAPTNPADPRTETPYPLPHNSGELWTGALKLVAPVTDRTTLRLFGLHSEEQLLLYDPAYKYDVGVLAGAAGSGGSGERSSPVRRRSAQSAALGRSAGGALRPRIPPRRGRRRRWTTSSAHSPGSRLHFVGEDLAKEQDSQPDPIPGFGVPAASENTPWGVPAFFLGDGSHGDLAWNRFGETRVQLDMLIGGQPSARFLSSGGEFTSQQVRTWQRVFGFLPVGAPLPDGTDVPAVALSVFSPQSVAGYAEAQVRIEDIAITGGLRYDQFDAGSDLVDGVAWRAALAQPSLRHLDRAERRDVRRQLRTLQPGAGLPVPGGCRLRRQHAYRPVPAGQSGHRVRRGHAVRVQRARPTAAVALGAGRRVRQAARRPGRVGAAGREPRQHDLRQRRRRQRQGPGGAAGARFRGRRRLPARLQRCRRRWPPLPIRSCSTGSSW